MLIFGFMNGEHYDFETLATTRSASYSQEEFARLLGIHPVSWNRVENGRSASFEVLLKACNLLKLDIRDIVRPSNLAVA